MCVSVSVCVHLIWLIRTVCAEAYTTALTAQIHASTCVQGRLYVHVRVPLTRRDSCDNMCLFTPSRRHQPARHPGSQQGSWLMSDMHHGLDTQASVCAIACTQNNNGYLDCRRALMSNPVGGKNKTRLDERRKKSKTQSVCFLC